MCRPAIPCMTNAVRGAGRRGKWISWSSEGSPHFQFPSPGMSPRPAHCCSGRPPGPPGVTQPEKPEPRLSRASRHRKGKTRKRQCAVEAGNPPTSDNCGEPGLGVNIGSRRAQRPDPGRDTLSTKLTHTRGSRGLPRRVAWRPVPRKLSARKGAPKAPAQGARCAFPPEDGLRGPSVNPETSYTRTTPPQGTRGRTPTWPDTLHFWNHRTCV